jgi:competence protein ComEA
MSKGAVMTANCKVDINAASAEELDQVTELRGRGFEIVRYRDARGRFSDLRQLDEVPGLCGKVPPDTPNLTVGQ